MVYRKRSRSRSRSIRRRRTCRKRSTRRRRTQRAGDPLTELDAQGFVTTPGQDTIVPYRDVTEPYSVIYPIGSIDARAMRKHDQSNMP
jgi:hypothetical protein